MNTQRKQGRPPVDEPRSYVRNIRLTEAEGQEVEEAAARAGVPLARFIREAALEKARQK